jgi:hypothetical protein
LRKAFRSSWFFAPGIGPIPKEDIVNCIVTLNNPLTWHAEFDEIVTMARTSYQCCIEQADPVSLDELLPPHPRAVNGLALGHKDGRSTISACPAYRSY